MSDPFFESVVSLLHFDDADGGSVFEDRVPGRVWTPHGSVTTSSDFPLFGNTLKSVNGGYITCTHPSFAINTQAFTYELRVKLQTAIQYGYNRVFMQHGEEHLYSGGDINGFMLRIINHTSGYRSDLLSRWNSDVYGTYNFTPPSDYVHIAIVGDGVNVRGYYEGVDEGGREAYSAFNSQTLRLGWGDLTYGVTSRPFH